jgi:hypothetical protein
MHANATRHYCTLFDRNYLIRGLALHRSLMRNADDFSLHVLCLDEPTREALCVLSLPRTELISLETLQAWDPALQAVRPARRPAEFFFTCKPVLLGYLLERHPTARRLTYLDSDLFFFSDAAASEKEYAESPIALAPHRFSVGSEHRARFGRFNAGWISVDSSREARRFIGWWRDRCIEWCSLTVEDTRFGDQKYLDQVPALFPGTTVVSHPGINAGPWNLDARAVEVLAGRAVVGGRPLVVFHFHGIRRMLFDLYDCGLYEYGVTLTPEIKSGIYRPYLEELAACTRQTSALPAATSARLELRVLPRLVALTARALMRRSAVHAAA